MVQDANVKRMHTEKLLAEAQSSVCYLFSYTDLIKSTVVVLSFS